MRVQYGAAMLPPLFFKSISGFQQIVRVKNLFHDRLDFALGIRTKGLGTDVTQAGQAVGMSHGVFFAFHFENVHDVENTGGPESIYYFYAPLLRLPEFKNIPTLFFIRIQNLRAVGHPNVDMSYDKYSYIKNTPSGIRKVLNVVKETPDRLTTIPYIKNTPSVIRKVLNVVKETPDRLTTIPYIKNTPSGIRTPDRLIKSQLLYQLS